MKKRWLLIIATLYACCPANGYAEILNVKKFGAKGDGRSDDTKAIQKAVDAAPVDKHTVIYFPKGVYLLQSYTVTANYLENYFIRMRSNILFKGDGKGSVIRAGKHLFDKKDINATAQLFYGTQVQNISFSNLLIDMNGANNLVPVSSVKNQRAIFINHGADVTIDNITIKNNAGRNMIMLAGRGKRALVRNSVFLNGGHYVGTKTENKNQQDFTFIYFEWDSTRVINNRIEQQNVAIALGGISGGIELHGAYGYASGNIITGCSPGLYVESSWYDVKKTIVENNRFINCTKGISFWVNYRMDSISIKNNFIQLTDYGTWKDYISAGILMPNGNTSTYDFKHANASTVTNLLISGNIIVSPPGRHSSRSAGMVLHSIYNSTITDNTVTGMNFGGIIIQGSKWGSSGVKITHNTFSDFKDNTDTLVPASYITVFDSYVMQAADAPGIKDIIVSGNTFIKGKAVAIATPPAKKGEFYGAFIALPYEMQKEVTFEKNVFSDTTERVQFRGIKQKQ